MALLRISYLCLFGATFGQEPQAVRHIRSDVASTAPDCPLPCWDVDSAGTGCAPMQNCQTITCGAEKMDIIFDLEVFGLVYADIKDDQTNIFEGIESTNADAYADSVWLSCSFDTATSDCGIVATENGNDIDFTVRLSLKSEKTSFGSDVVLDLNGPEITVNVLCKYPASFSIDSTFSIDAGVGTEGDVQGDVPTDGFKPSFTLSVFDTNAFADAVTSILIGAHAYVQAEWGITQSLVLFHVSDCTISNSGTDIPIIKETCYSSALSAEPIGSKQGLATVSFMFKMFNIPDSSGETSISCTIKLCTAAGSSCVVNTDDKAACPTADGYNYSPNGKP